jgi:hypothetical protein
MNTNKTWRKSTRSNAESACVELSVGVAQTSIRDTKNRTAGTLTLPAPAFGSFLRSLGVGR